MSQRVLDEVLRANMADLTFDQISAPTEWIVKLSFAIAGHRVDREISPLQIGDEC